MNPSRFRVLTSRYSGLHIAVLGDFCLDRYLEIDPQKNEVSLETGLTAYNVVKVRSQPGGAGTIVANLAALGVGRISAIGFCGDDAEGYELQRSLRAFRRLSLEHFICARHRQTFTYTKPLLVNPGKPPLELNRLDFKNWSRTPPWLGRQLARNTLNAARHLDALIVLGQTDTPEYGVLTREVLRAISTVARRSKTLPVIADSRAGLRGFPPVMFKLNQAELATHVNSRRPLGIDDTRRAAQRLAEQNRQTVFVTLSEHGLLAAAPRRQVEHVPALPLRGPIDVVGAGDAVTANLAAALAAKAELPEALELASLAASVVVHKVGTTGTASRREIARLLITLADSPPRHRAVPRSFTESS